MQVAISLAGRVVTRAAVRCGVAGALRHAPTRGALRIPYRHVRIARALCTAVPVTPAELEATISDAAEAVAAAAQDPSQEEVAAEAVAAAREASAVAADLGMGPGDEANLTIEAAGSVRTTLSSDGFPLVRVNGSEVDAAWLRQHDDRAPASGADVTLVSAEVTHDGLLDVTFSDGHASQLDVGLLVETGPDAE